MSNPLSGLTNAQIEARIADLFTRYQALNLTEDSDDEALAAAEALANEVGELRGELNTRAERSNRITSISDIFTVPEPVVDEVAEEPGAEVEPVLVVDEPVVEEILEPVAASAEPVAPKVKPAVRAATASSAPKVVVPTRATASLTAAADVPNYPAGHKFESLSAAADAVISRARSLPTHYAPNTRLRYSALKIEKQGYGDLVQNPSGDDRDLINRAGDEKRLPGGSLTAAGDAWCAPSMTDYTLCQPEVADGLLSIPEVQVTRGGIRFASGPDFSEIYSNKDFFFSMDSDGVIKDGSGTTVTEKPCGVVTCPDFEEIRLDVNGVCVSVNILQNVAYPELTERVISGVLVAHERKMNAANLAGIKLAAGTAISVPDNSTLLFNLDYLEWYATATRNSYSLPENATIEAVADNWLKPLVRAELARRNGVDYAAVDDAFIGRYFSVRGINPQFVRDFNPTSTVPGGVSIPALANVLMYPAGSWVRGTQAVISMDTIYDSSLLKQNKYLGLFTEEAWLLVQRCLGTLNLQIPVSVSGLTGAQVTEVLGTAT